MSGTDNKKPGIDPVRGYLTEQEWKELVALEYVLTWRYSKDEAEDERRYKELVDKKWKSLE